MMLQRTNRLRALALGAVAVSGALVLTACGSDTNTSKDAQKAAAKIKCDGKGKLLASGSTAQKNAVDAWVKNYQTACKETQINYKDIGSGGGIQEWLQGTTAFAGSDSALKPEEVAKSKKICKGGQGINLPMVGGPVAISYNLPGVEDLVLDAPTIAKIFDSKIKKWNDPAIKKLNPGAKLPSTDIQPFHRSDESGTTQNLGKYLGAAAKDDWKYPDEKSWPAKGGQSASGSAGVAQQVKQTDGAIGYFELSYATANNLDTVKLDTGASKPVEATTSNASKAIADAEVVGKGKDLALDLNYATKAEGAYPLMLVTYEIACDKGNDKSSLEATKSFLTYTASKDGQAELAELGYAPLPDEIAEKVRSTIPELS
ncbi:phosphate ABC transporter substrate-binding protein PstS [Streptomyces sp. WMMB 322]|uniref:phosphate ABC transporter substrate-binding protein PstS n=1 Tax=Streptomyces sp. WMMB 322 TaxID=1286821 RepID=UPI0006E1BEFA|nr:phosphate ABC transporter substrate-binding protein PstS [Streptomyces sp. WMMB 322]SCK04992.1 phosphate transport system substrate-binding protein [Streptomyces sp. WMMB 322]